MEPTPASATREVSQRRVLVVEDDADSAESLSDILALAGYEVQVARSAEDALEVAPIVLPHFVLIDIGLPGQLDGYDLAVLLRAHPATARTRLIATTGYAGREASARSSAAGFDLHLTKPLNTDVLLADLAAGPVRGSAVNGT